MYVHRFVNVAYCWLVVTMVYYGLTMGASTLIPGSPYLNFLVVSLVEIPGYTLSYMTMNKLGRKWSMALCLMVAGTACLADGVINQCISDKSMTAGVQVSSLVLN